MLASILDPKAGPLLCTGGLYATTSAALGLTPSRVLNDFKSSVPEDLGSVESTSHLLPLQEPAQFTIIKNNQPVLKTTGGNDRDILRSNRSKLRDFLSAHLDIKWNKNLAQIEENADTVTLHFDDGTSATGDVLVGADGVHSKGKATMYRILIKRNTDCG